MKELFILVLFVLLSFLQVNAYQNQGFENYVEKNGDITFSCKNQCFILIGQKGYNNLINVTGNFSGDGVIGYGFLNGQQVIPGEFKNVVSGVLNKKFFLNSLKYYSQLPKDINVVFIIDGNLEANNFNLSFYDATFLENFINYWDSFWNFDSFKPYTINLLYGPTISGDNANKIFYFLFIISLLGLFFVRNKKNYVMIIFMLLRIIYDIRMTLEFFEYFRYDYKTYISQDIYNRTYRDRGKFYSFIEFIKNNLKPKISKFEIISFYSDYNRPFYGIIRYFLYPYDVVFNKYEDNKIFIVHLYSKYKFEKGILFLEGNKIGEGDKIDFDNNSFIFIKK